MPSHQFRSTAFLILALLACLPSVAGASPIVPAGYIERLERHSCIKLEGLPQREYGPGSFEIVCIYSNGSGPQLVGEGSCSSDGNKDTWGPHAGKLPWSTEAVFFAYPLVHEGENGTGHTPTKLGRVVAEIAGSMAYEEAVATLEKDDRILSAGIRVPIHEYDRVLPLEERRTVYRVTQLDAAGFRLELDHEAVHPDEVTPVQNIPGAREAQKRSIPGTLWVAALVALASLGITWWIASPRPKRKEG